MSVQTIVIKGDRVLRDGRGRIRCSSESGYWRDCGDWATQWLQVFDPFIGEMRNWPECDKHAAAIGQAK